LGQSVGVISGDSPRDILTAFPYLVLEVRPAAFARAANGGALFGLEGATFHTADVLHLLEDLLAFVD
jgi:hypothetical protein